MTPRSRCQSVTLKAEFFLRPEKEMPTYERWFHVELALFGDVVVLRGHTSLETQ